MDDFIFEREPNKSSTAEDAEISFTELRRVINDSFITDRPLDFIQVCKKKVANKLIDIFSIQDDITFSNTLLITDNPDVIDRDMIMIGKISNCFLLIDIPPINVKIDLKAAIQNAILHKKPNLIHYLMSYHVDPGLIEPKIFSMCIESKQDQLLDTLISNKVSITDYHCFYLLAAHGKLSVIQKILSNYKFSQTTLVEIVGKICIQAILNNHVHILKYFFNKEAFVTAPDQMAVYFINSIKYGNHLDVVKFFIESGIDIRQDDYLAVKCADQMGKSELIKYFYQIEPSISNILSEKQLETYGIKETMKIKQYLENQTCLICCDDITFGQEYYQCKNAHYFDRKCWIEWAKNDSSWKCPQCLADMDINSYLNDHLFVDA